MPKGGARTRSGPAPDPNALRRDRKSDGEWLLLPAEGRAGDPPTWPLLGQSEREAEVWESRWRKPQAVAWERFGLVDSVALYVRRWCESEEPGSPTNLGTLIRQYEDDLGISLPGMLRLRWRIVDDETAARRETRQPVKRSSSRDRLKVVPGDGA
jgi:hypothetical protein